METEHIHLDNIERSVSRNRPAVVERVSRGISKIFEGLRSQDDLPTLSNGRHLVIGRPLHNQAHSDHMAVSSESE